MQHVSGYWQPSGMWRTIPARNRLDEIVVALDTTHERPELTNELIQLIERTEYVTTIYLVRHGENPANINHEFSHRKVDYSLTPLGIEQAQQTAAYFRTLPIRAVYASPLKRAVETAHIIAEPLGLDVVELEQFREVNVGALEGPPATDELWAFHDEIMEHWYAGRHDVTFPEGESYLMLLARLQDGLREVVRCTPDGPSIVVAHGGIFTALRSVCSAVEISTIRQGTRNCAITEIDVQLDGDQLVGDLQRWADCTHLQG